MRYLIRFSLNDTTELETLGASQGVYLTPEGDSGWAILEKSDEQSLRDNLGVEAKEIKPLLSIREYSAIRDAREELEEAKGRFVDDPSGALQDGRRSVGRALETIGYPAPERAEEAPEARREILEEYSQTDSEGADVGDMREAFSRLSDILERSARV